MEQIFISLAVALIVILTDSICCDGNIGLQQVRQGGTVTLPCDIVMTTGSHINWFRNCSHKYQPTLIISPTMLKEEPMIRFIFVKKEGVDSYDLQIKGVTAADEGVYFCANTEKKNGEEHYSYGQKVTRVELIGRGPDECEEINKTSIDCSACPEASSTSSGNDDSSLAFLPDCSHCWIMLYSLCAVCILLCGILIITCTAHVCLKNDIHEKEAKFYSHGTQYKAHGLNKEHRCQSFLRGERCLHTEVIYRPLGSSHTHFNQ